MNSNNNNNNSTSTSDGTSLGQSEFTSMGVRLTTRPVTTISSRPGYTGKHPDSDQTIQESGWTLANMLERFSFVKTYPWTASLPSHNIIASLRVPHDLAVNSLVAAPFKNFSYWRGDIELNFQVTATPFHQGMLCAVFVPLTPNYAATESIISNFSSMTVNQCIYLFANANTTGTMHIPFNSPMHYLDIVDTTDQTPRNTLGFVYIVVFNPIELSASASDTATVSVFSRFVNNQFKVPRISEGPLAFAVAQSTTVKNALHHVSGNLIDKIVDTVLPDNALGDVIDVASKFLTLMDSPTDPNQSAVIVNGMNRLNFSEGVQYIDRLMVHPSQTFCATEETFATTEDEMSFDYLKKKYSYLGTVNLTTSVAYGATIASFPMNPIPINMTYGRNIQIPLLSYLSLPFMMWRGSITYKFQVVATSLQTCKLFIALNYGATSIGAGVSIDKATSQYGQAFEINQGTNDIEISVPFNSTTPYKYVPNSSTIQPFNNTTLGYINLMVLNPLVAPNNTPTTIHINVFIAGGDDFELSTLTDSNNVVPSDAFVPSFLSDYVIAEAQSSTTVAPAFVTSSVDTNFATQNLVAPESNDVARDPVSQKYVLSIKDLLRKYQLFPNIQFSVPAAPASGGTIFRYELSSIFSYHNQLSTSVPSATFTNPGLFGHFAPLFRSFKGSLRFKLFANAWQGDSFNTISVFYAPPHEKYDVGSTTINASMATSIYTGGNAPVTWNTPGTLIPNVKNMTRLPVHVINGQQKTAEFEIPFSSIYNSLIPPVFFSESNSLLTVGNMSTSNFGTLWIYASNSQAITLVQLEPYIALGDDARFGTLFNVPYVYINTLMTPGGVLSGCAWPDQYGLTSAVSTLSRL